MTKDDVMFAFVTVQTFLATNLCNEYLVDITTEERTFVLNTLLKIENNMRKKMLKQEGEKNEKI